MADPTAAPPPVKWELQIETGPRLTGLSRAELLDAIRSGWARLDDEVRPEGGEWKSMRYSLCEADFDFQVYVDPGRAFANRFAGRAAGIGAALALIVGLYFTYSQVPGLTGYQRAVLTFGSAVAVPLVLGGLMAFPAGLLVVGAVVFFGLPVLAGVAGVQPRGISSLLFNFWVWMPLILGAAVGAAIGAGLGTLAGRQIGRARAATYVLPSSRTALPEWTTQRTVGPHSAPTTSS